MENFVRADKSRISGFWFLVSDLGPGAGTTEFRTWDRVGVTAETDRAASGGILNDQTRTWRLMMEKL
jgi:hypothetical protein